MTPDEARLLARIEALEARVNSLASIMIIGARWGWSGVTLDDLEDIANRPL